MNFESLHWTTLDSLRTRFLTGQPQSRPYWDSTETLEQYDKTFAERIGWKWDAVLKELDAREWLPPRLPLVDWGCGTGIAARRLIQHYPKGHFPAVHVWDHSPLAMAYATAQLQRLDSNLQIHRLPSPEPASFASSYLLLISHVWNELEPSHQSVLNSWMEQAAGLLWIEPGTYELGRQLQAIRDRFHLERHILAPCTHAAGCGLQTAGQESHWCHHFADPPAHVFQSRDWAQFARRAGIDLRALPYTFLVWVRRELTDISSISLGGEWERILGRPRVFKPYVRLLSCGACGVRELDVPKRTHPNFWKSCKKGNVAALYQPGQDQSDFRAPGP
jgi:SAM-dependent methyltransferase